MQQQEVIAEADYVIVGGGTAGAVVARRLAEDPEVRVILIEAGGDGRGLLVQLPVGFLGMMQRPKYDWAYEQEKDPTIGDRAWVWSAGKMLGGSSSLNGQVYIRGVSQDFDEWAEMGAEGWSFSEIFPYFLRSEKWAGAPSQAHGSEGPLAVTPLRDPHPTTATFLEGCAQIGLPTLEEHNDCASFGAFMAQTNQRDGWRCSTEKGYLRPFLKKSNLQIFTDSEVEKVQIEDGRATGVLFRRDGRQVVARARREVILSAGTLGSPALLMRSGIGPGEILRARNIPVVHEAAGVGANLQEHSASATTRLVSVRTLNNETGPFDGLKHLARFLWNKKGPLGAPAVQAMAFAKTREELQRPDVQLHFMPLVYGAFDGQTPTRMGIPVCSAITISVSLCKPKGRGHIVLDKRLMPKVIHQALGNAEDVETLIAGLKMVDRLYDTPALARIVEGRMSPAQKPENDAQWLDHLRESLNLTWHQVGTCRMGSDQASVVDPQLRVRGISGLRVVDASVMPTPTSGNTNAATIMIGEKAAEMIRLG